MTRGCSSAENPSFYPILPSFLPTYLLTIIESKNDAATRAQALTLLQKGVAIDKIIKDTNYARRSIYNILKKAKDYRYDSSKDTRILLSYVEDAPRSGRPKKCTLEIEEQVINIISQNSTTRELSTQKIANTLALLIKGGISARSIHRILRRRGYKPCKLTRKPGLTQANKLKRLK